MKSNKTILLVDNEKDMFGFLRNDLIKEGFLVECIESDKKCLKYASKHHPDFILLNVSTPKMSTIEVCRALRYNHNAKNIPIIMLSANHTESDIVEAFAAGTDDYVIKPFSIKILVARINAIFRRTKNKPKNIITVEDITLNMTAREVVLKGKKLELTFSQFEILLLFIKNLETVFTRKQIVKAIRGENYPVTERAVDVHIVEMRKLLKDYGTRIKTVRGIGYKLSIEPLKFDVL